MTGNFSINAVAGCAPFKVNVSDLSGGSNVHYNFQWSNNSVKDLAYTNSFTPTSFVYTNSLPYPVTYTIIQYGEKKGKPMYACKNIIVKGSNQPVFEYSACGNYHLEVIVPVHPANDYSSYTIDWGESPFVVNPTNPTTRVETINQPAPFHRHVTYLNPPAYVTISVKGNGGSTLCSNPAPINVLLSGINNQPEITKFEMAEDKSSVQLDFTGAVGRIYALYRRRPNETFTYGNFALETVEGKHTFPTKGVGNECFYIFSNNTNSGYTTCDQYAGEVCTTPLTLKKTDDKKSELEFSYHPVNLKALITNGYPSSTTKKIQTELIIQDMVSGVIRKTSTSSGSIIDPADCTTHKCYQISTEVSGERLAQYGLILPFTYEVLSNKVCVNKSVHKPDALSDYYISLEKSQNVFTFSDPVAANKLYQLVQPLADIVVDVHSNVSPFIQNNEFQNKQSCYRLAYLDPCNRQSEISSNVCTIFLGHQDMKAAWSANNPFSPDSVDHYELEYLADTTGQIIIDVIPHINPTESTIEIELGADIKRFVRIKTISTSGKLSYSNVIKIEKDTIKLKENEGSLFYFPTAFTPNGQNPEFKIMGVIDAIENYSLVFYDRWGKTVHVLKTNDPLVWNGTLDGKILQGDLYFFDFKALLKNKTSYQKKGYVYLLGNP